VQTTVSLANAVRQITAGTYEGSPKWLTIARNQDVLNYGAQQASVNNPDLFNTDCSVMPVIAYLADHRADYARPRGGRRGHLRARAHDGRAPLPARRGQLRRRGRHQYRRAEGVARDAAAGVRAVGLLCLITFRSWRAVVVAVVPLVVTSILCEALMVALGIGVKVATLPVVALGVGIGVDYALYLLSVQLSQQRTGSTLAKPTPAPCASPARSWCSSA
jgi:uncharacterized membrane protein